MSRYTLDSFTKKSEQKDRHEGVFAFLRGDDLVRRVGKELERLGARHRRLPQQADRHVGLAAVL